MSNIYIVLLATTFTLILASCNTMHGAGTDIKQGGKALERAADKHRPADTKP